MGRGILSTAGIDSKLSSIVLEQSCILVEAGTCVIAHHVCVNVKSKCDAKDVLRDCNQRYLVSHLKEFSILEYFLGEHNLKCVPEYISHLSSKFFKFSVAHNSRTPHHTGFKFRTLVYGNKDQILVVGRKLNFQEKMKTSFYFFSSLS